ncbi:acyltransferase family protein [Nocardioides hankookensis]|uniref:Acyltransferase family protein n=1 Tax=Nocardioides hankookensis TaxID=443157 RepID=A0ABW1LBY5_9ACTN
MNSENTVRRGFRPEIQGLRAVAVLLVIAYHLYPNRVPGGYVGVDVFFVLSGFLITSHLFREADSTSHLSLVRFWGRRIRRLLPASLLVLAVSLVLTWVWVPQSMWEQTLRQIGASALYVENWALAAEAVDYSAIGNEPTLVQHYWSLSVEEQFYLVWPLLVVAALLLVRRRGVALRPVLTGVFGAVVLASFVYSVVITSHDTARAYFVTPTRAWEFGVGALVGLLGASADPWLRTREPLRVLLGWAGLAAVVWAGFALSDATAFPGWIAAVPVLGTAAVIVAGTSTAAGAVSRPLSWRPATFVGDISYAMYLWHWPLIVVLPFITGVDLRTRDKVGIFLATLVVSWACTRWVEDPVRTNRALADVPWRAYALGAAGMVVVVASAGALHADLNRDVAAAQAASDRVVEKALAGDTPCIGPSTLDPENRADCGPVGGEGDPIQDPAAVVEQNDVLAFPGCMSMPTVVAVHTCDLGTTDDPKRTIAVAGDSHSTHWFPAFDRIGRERGWRVRTFTRSGCPLTDATAVRKDWPEHRYELCRDGNEDIERQILADPEIDTVFVSADSSTYQWEQGPDTDFADPATDGFHAVWQRLTDAGKQVVVIHDVPETKDSKNSPNCVAANPGDPEACASPRDRAVVPDAEADAVATAGPGVRLIKLTDQFCDDELCYAVIGRVIVYRDFAHVSEEYSTLMAPYLSRAFDAVDEPLG